MISKNEPSVAEKDMIESLEIQDFNWIDVFSDGVFITDESWKLIRWNSCFLQLLGISTHEQLHKQDIFKLLELIDYRPDMKMNQIVTMAFTLPGTDTSFYLKLTKIQKNNKTIGLGIISNQTLEIRNEEWCNHVQFQLVKNQQNHILEKRLEGLIHNINTPLNTIIGYVQILMRESPQSNALKKIYESGFQIDASLKSVSDKIEANRSQFIQQINVNSVILNELEIAKSNLFFKHNVNVQLELSEHLPEIKMVHGDLSYCLDAVLWNAIESLCDQEEKNIYIETKMEKGYLQIIIRDTGSGILPKDMPFIYQMGFSTRKDDQSEHLGLGLSFTKQVIHDCHGNIVVISEPLVGTTVTIKLPVEDAS